MAAALVCAAFLAACSSDPEPPDDIVKVSAPEPGAYTGVFPCDGCPGIPTAIWLREGGYYFLEQVYSANGKQKSVTSLGRWTWQPDSETLELRGAGPRRIFARADRASLVMRTDSPLEHRLTRDGTRGHFEAIIAVTGTLDPNGDVGTFAECISGMRVPVSRGADYSSFARQYRRTIPPGSAAFVEFEGQFRWREDGQPAAIAIRNFLTVRPDGRCNGAR